MHEQTLAAQTRPAPTRNGNRLRRIATQIAGHRLLGESAEERPGDEETRAAGRGAHVGGKIRRQASQPRLQQREDRIDDRHDSSPPSGAPAPKPSGQQTAPGAAGCLADDACRAAPSARGESPSGRSARPVYSHNRIWPQRTPELSITFGARAIASLKEQGHRARSAEITSVARPASGHPLWRVLLCGKGDKRGVNSSSKVDCMRQQAVPLRRQSFAKGSGTRTRLRRRDGTWRKACCY